MTTLASLARELESILSPDALVTDAADLPAYGHDFWEQRGTPGAVVRPRQAGDVVATMRFAREHGIPVVPRAAGTNIPAGFIPTPERILLDLRSLDRIVEIDQARGEAIVQPGVLNGALQARLAPLGLCFSPDPASASISTIGGNIAENAGGPRCLKYGVTVHHVAAVQCVLPGGETLYLDAGDDGPDLLGVLIGSEGTLGVITEARLRLRPLPAVTRTLLAVFDRAEQAAEAASAVIASGVIPAAMEFFDRAAVALLDSYAPTGYPTDAEATLLIDVEGSASQVGHDMELLEAILRRHAREVIRADDDLSRADLWRGRLLVGHATAASGLAYLNCDTTVPRERIPEMQRIVHDIALRQRLDIPLVGHAGDGNLHAIILYDRSDPRQVAAMQAATDEVVLSALALGGTFTGEHGVGSEKLPYMERRFTPVEIAAMRAVKEVFDPGGVLNPGILLPDPLPGEPPLPRFASAVQTALAARLSGELESPAATPTAVTEGAEAAPALDVENLTVTVDADMSLSNLHAVLSGQGFHCSLLDGGSDARVSVGTATACATNRADVRDSLLAIRATLPDGPAVRFGSNAVKDVAGYDLKRLFIGSAAAFGTLTEATLRLTPLRG